MERSCRLFELAARLGLAPGATGWIHVLRTLKRSSILARGPDLPPSGRKLTKGSSRNTKSTWLGITACYWRQPTARSARNGGARGGDRCGDLPDRRNCHQHGTGGPGSPERSNKNPFRNRRHHRDHGRGIFYTGRKREGSEPYRPRRDDWAGGPGIGGPTGHATQEPRRMSHE